MNFTSSGLLVIRMPPIKELMATDLPVPVAPATRRCGILPKSLITVLPVISLPSISGSSYLSTSCVNFLTISFVYTKFGVGLGISTPMKEVPGIGASILKDAVCDANARAKSLLRFFTFETFVPVLILNENLRTVGPTDIATTLD